MTDQHSTPNRSNLPTAAALAADDPTLTYRGNSEGSEPRPEARTRTTSITELLKNDLGDGGANTAQEEPTVREQTPAESDPEVRRPESAPDWRASRTASTLEPSPAPTDSASASPVDSPADAAVETSSAAVDPAKEQEEVKPATTPAWEAPTPTGPFSSTFPDSDVSPDSLAPVSEPAEQPKGPQPVLQVTPDAAAGFFDHPTPPRPETSADLQAARVLRERSGARSAWGWTVYLSTLGRREAAESPRRVQERLWTAAAQTTIARHKRVAVLSLKGGVGKTTTVAGLGHTYASLRGDHVVAVDANPDQGTLADLVGKEHTSTVSTLLKDARDGVLGNWPNVRQHLSQAPSRLHVLASDSDPELSNAYNAVDYARTCQVLERFVSLVITDCGTGMTNNALSGEGGVLDQADQLVVVCGPGVADARSASATLDQLESNRWKDLAQSAVVAVTKVPTGPPKKTGVDYEEIENHFRTRVRETVRIPWDAHLHDGAQADLGKMASQTRRAFLHLAASVGEKFSEPPNRP